MGFWEDVAALEWQVELGVDEAILDAPQDRFATAQAAEESRARKPGDPAAHAAPTIADPVDAVAVARAAAEAAESLDALAAALGAYEHCELKRGARNLVFADGMPGAPLMVVGEAPGRDEDRAGRPFVGRAGALLDRMLAAIGMARDAGDREGAVYITNVMPWRPPENRDPSPEEIAMMLPFLARHIELAAPRVILAMGNHATFALLGRRGITRLRGTWAEAFGRPVMPMLHPAYLLRTPEAKREAWADLLAVRARLEDDAS